MKKIILIDDNEPFCASMTYTMNFFQEADFSVYYNALHFLKEYQASWDGYLIIDLLMPHIDGFSLIRELQKKNNKMHTIVISGHADTNIEKQVKNLGVNHFLLKPFDINTLLGILELTR